LIPDRRTCALVQRQDVASIQYPDAPCTRFKIINQESRSEFQFVCQTRGFHNPGQIRDLGATVPHRSRDAKAGSIDTLRFVIEESGNDSFQTREVPTAKCGFTDELEMAIVSLEEG
jgi:hypothetical protein